MKMKLFVVFCLVSLACFAQQATELFIPIGKSPGLSREGKTIIGKVNAISSDKIVTVSGRTVRVVDASEIYFDRSSIKKQNTYGKFDDIKIDKSVEVYAPSNSIVIWLKIQSE